MKKLSPFQLDKIKYIWYCKSCWITGVVAFKKESVPDDITDTCFQIHSITGVSRKCNATRKQIKFTKA